MKPFGVTGLLLRGNLVCAVSKRWDPQDVGIPGGKVEFGESPEDAVRREVKEEVGIDVLRMEFVYEREDSTNNQPCWCYRILEWTGEPHQMEPGIEVSWVTFDRLLDPRGTYAPYNMSLFKALGLIPS